MKFCTKCGTQMADNVAFCPNCGSAVAQLSPQQPAQQTFTPPQQIYSAPQQPYQPTYQQPYQPTYQQPYQPYPQPVQRETGMQTAAKILMIISTVIMGIYIIPLAWCLPMTISYFRKLKNNEPVTTGFKICVLLFVNLISGILMLCEDN